MTPSEVKQSKLYSANILRFVYEADTDWCKQFLLPRFDWSNEARATRLWDGYLSHGGWTR
jgi:hypothetical protein